MQKLARKDIGRIAFDSGFLPLPLRGKIPFYKDWQNTDPQKWEELFDRIKGDNVGILTGKLTHPFEGMNEVVVLDVDTRDNGVEEWLKYIQDKEIPETMIVRTGSGGLHYYFRYRPETTGLLRNAKNTILPSGIDVKTTGGQVVFPGSTHPDTKKPYVIIGGVKDDKPIIAEMPDWLLEALLTTQAEFDKRRR